MEIVKKLMVHMDKAEGTHYRDELLAKIVEISSQSNYQYITNFEWYVINRELCVSSQKGSFKKYYLSYWKFHPISCICCYWRLFFFFFIELERLYVNIWKRNYFLTCFYSTGVFRSCFVYASLKVMVSKHIYSRYVSVLVELTRMEGTRHGRMIASQMLDVAIRVQAIRPFAVSQMVRTSFLPWKHVAISL